MGHLKNYFQFVQYQSQKLWKHLEIGKSSVALEKSRSSIKRQVKELQLYQIIIIDHWIILRVHKKATNVTTPQKW